MNSPIQSPSLYSEVPLAPASDWRERCKILICRVVTVFLIVIAGALTLPLSIERPALGLDASWGFGLNYFPLHGVVFGRDTVFTYGPLGFFGTPMDFGQNLLIGNLARVAIWLILLVCASALGIRERLGVWRTAVLVASLLVASRPLLYWTFDLFIVVTMLFVVVAQHKSPRRYPTLFLLGLLSGILALVKASGYPSSLLVILLFLSLSYTEWRKERRWPAVSLVVFCFLAGPIAYLVYNPSGSGLYTYFRSVSELTRGYSETMGIASNPRDTFFAVVVILLYLVQLVLAVRNRALKPISALILAILTFISFKHGFVRADVHVVLFFAMLVVYSGVALCLTSTSLLQTSRWAALWLAIAWLGFSAITASIPSWRTDIWSVASSVSRWQSFLDWPATAAALKSASEQPWAQLPADIQGQIAGARVAVFPSEMSYAASGQFELQPLFSFQAYSAYTPFLDEQTAVRLIEKAGRTDYVLMDWSSIDGRHPLLDVPSTAKALEGTYEPATLSGGHLLLKPRKFRHEPALVVKSKADLKIGQWINVPKSDLPMWASVKIPESLRGSLKTNLLRAPDLTMEIDAADESRYRYKVVRANLINPFELSSFSPDLASYARLLGDHIAGSPIHRLRFVSDANGSDFGASEIIFLAETNGSIRIQEPTRESFQSHFKIESPLKINHIATGSTDLVNGRPNSAGGLINPVPVSRSHGLQMAGWIATGGSAAGQVFDELYGVAGNTFVRAQGLARPDVAAYFKAPGIAQCGFELSISGDRLQPGVQAVYVVGLVRKENLLYRGNPMWIDVR